MSTLLVPRSPSALVLLLALHSIIIKISKTSFLFDLLRISSNISVVQGTTFVLQKKTEPRQRLLSTISTGKGVREVRLPIQLLHYMSLKMFFVADLVSLCQHYIAFAITLAGNWWVYLLKPESNWRWNRTPRGWMANDLEFTGIFL